MDRRAMLLAVGLALLVGVPFLGKAFHIDDTFVLRISAQILRQPLRPLNATINWGRGETPMFERTKNPPLVSYYLAPFIHCFGYSERVLHGAMLVFLVMLAAGTALLGRWFWVDEWWPMLFVMLSPAIVVSGNVMRDVPAAGLLTLGLALFVLGTDEDRRRWTAAGATLVGLAALTKYSSAALIPLLVLYPLVRRRRRAALWALIPIGLLGLWCLQNWWSQGLPHLVRLLQQRAAKEEGFGRPWDEKLLAGLTIAGSMLFLVPVVIVAWLPRRAWLGLPLLALAGAAAALGVNLHFGKDRPTARPDLVVRADGFAVAGRILSRTDDSLTMRIRDHRLIRVPRRQVADVSPEGDRVVRRDGHAFVGKVVVNDDDKVVLLTKGWRNIRLPRERVARAGKLSWQYHLWATTGAVLLAAAVGGGLVAALWAWRRRENAAADWLFLVLWAGGAIAFSVLFTPFQATRHFLPALAPLTVLLLRLLGPRRKPVQIALGAMLAVQAVVAYTVAFADAEFAGAHREFARDAARRYQRPDQEVWFNGHWGWQHYAETVHGFHHYWRFRGEGTTPPPGAILLEPQKVHHRPAVRDLGDCLVEIEQGRRVFEPTFPARTMDGVYSYFYAVTEHRMPYHLTFSDAPVETCRVFRIQAAGEAQGGEP